MRGADYNRRLIPVWRQLGIARRCLIADCTCLPLRDDSFAATASADFLEHVYPDQLPAVLGEISRIAGAAYHVVHLMPESTNRGPGGENLHVAGHLTEEEWRELAHGCFGDVTTETRQGPSGTHLLLRCMR